MDFAEGKQGNIIRFGKMKYLNLGCGYRFHPEWTNVDFVSRGKEVIAHNLSEGIPFEDNSFDVVYHSHLIEHLPKSEAESFLLECYRVLRPQGVLRVVVPDLEEMVCTYLKLLEEACSGSQKLAANNYEWILLEWYDQTVRNQPGGEMLAYLSEEEIANEEFVLARCGREFKSMIEFIRKQNKEIASLPKESGKTMGTVKHIYRFLRYPNYRREVLIKSLLGKEYKALQIGRFRQTGEIHQWMYDRYSLALLLKKCGWENIVQRTASSSYIPNWASFNLDTESDGTVYRPNSLFMESIKPSL